MSLDPEIKKKLEEAGSQFGHASAALASAIALGSNKIARATVASVKQILTELEEELSKKDGKK